MALLREQMRLWEPPRGDALIVATSGRFPADAITWAERHNQSDQAIRIELWRESHLEQILAQRPDLIAASEARHPAFCQWRARGRLGGF